MTAGFENRVFEIKEQDFPQYALDLFYFQCEHNPVYKAFADSLGVIPRHIQTIEKIPFLPVGFFKTHPVQTTLFRPEIVFESSGTSGSARSLHAVKELSVYRKDFIAGFKKFYGSPGDYCILGLLPAYLERTHSSLVYMVAELIKMSGHPESGFYLNAYELLFEKLTQLEKMRQKTLVIGVTFALLDFVERFTIQLKCTTVMETGGMKGRRREMTREELHGILKSGFGVDHIHSEYGMTELLSQAYAAGAGLFRPVPWLKPLVRSEDDPFEVRSRGTGIINMIDLANIYSCAFIATDDIGKIHDDGRFEILGRTDGSDMRGCSLLAV